MTPSNIIRAGCLLAVAATTVCAQEAPFCDADCNTTPRVCYNATELTRQVQLGLSDIWIHRSITLEDVLELNPPRDLNIRACNTVEVNCSPNGAFKIGEGAEGTTGDSIFIGGFSIVGCNGGAVKARSSNSITLQGLAITGPATEMSEPASALNSPTVLIDSCSFKGNRLDASVLEMGGGALYIDATNATIVHSEFHNNSANYGGAIFSTQALDVQNSNVTSNNCLKAGCGIYAIGLSVSNSRFSGNNNKGQREADPQTIEEATRGGAIYSELGLMATNIICEDNVAYMGGCWYTNSVTEQVSLTDSNFLRNLAHDSTEGSGLGGGGRSVSSMRIERCTFDSNQASSASIFQADGIVDIIDSDFRHNIGVSASSTLLYTGPVTVTNSNFHNNSAFNSGGGAINSEAAENFVQDSNFTMNIAGGGGGAISARGAVILIRSRFIANRANGGQSEQGFGGAVFADTLVAGETLYFGHNTAGLDGGAIVCRGDINISGAQFEFNSATENGGAISAFYQVALASSSFNGNTATGSGGALFLNDVIMANEVNFTNNDAAANGGAIYSSGIFPSYLVAARLTNNTASFGGGIYSENSKVELYNSIVQDNEAFSKGGALYVQQVVVRNSVIKCNKAIIGGALAITGVVVDLDNTTRITSNNGICSNIYFQSGLACEDGLGDDYCDCAFTAQMLAECGNGAVCDIEATKPFTTDVPCLCPEGWFLNTAGGLCIPCSTCGTSASQGECTSKQDVQCDCPTGKTGPNCEDDCKLPANCLEGDASTCQFDALDLSFGAVCTACNEGFYLQDSICIPCTTCPGNALPIEACTVTEDAVCACDAGKSGSACNINCEVPVGCSGLNLSTTVCQYSLDSGTKGIECTGCSSGFYHRQDNKQCAQITECNFNNEFEITSFNETADRVCQSVQTCHAGLDGTGTYTYSMFTKTKDTVCRSCTQSSSCVDGKLVSECTDDFDIICESCAEDYSGNACGYVNVAFQTQMSAQGVLNQTEILLNSWSSGSDIEIHVAENRRRAEDGVVTLNFTRSSADVLEYAMQSTNNRASLAATTESTALRIANEEPVDLDTNDDSLSAGAIIGIVACVLLVLCFVAGLIAFCMYRKRQRQAKKARIHPLFNLPANLLKRINDADAMVVRQKARESGEDIDPKRLKVVQKLGGGNFGEVFFAMLKDSHGRESPVAVKQLNDRQSEEAKDVFFEEANLMKSINHANVLDCIGISKGPPGAIIMDIMVLGDLHTYLSSQFDREEPVTIAEKYHLSYQIASGMNYLQSQGIVHRDLATRNCMLSLAGPNTLGYPTLKVADFGLSRVIDADTSDYVMESKTSLPFRWLSPRAMLEGRFSSASDVWSYGVTLWELFSNAEEIPYKGVNMFAILSKLQAGDRLERPDQCPKDAYDLMSACWKIKPENRPEFDTLERDFAYLFVPQCSVPVMVETSPDGSIVIIEGRDKRKFMDTGRLVAEGRVMGYDEEPEVPVYDDVNFKSDESTKKLNGQNSHGLAKGYENVHGADAKNKADELYDDVHGANLPSMARDYSNMPPSRGSLMPDEPEKLYNWSGAKLGDTAVSSPQRNLPIDSLARMLKDGDEAHLV